MPAGNVFYSSGTALTGKTAAPWAEPLPGPGNAWNCAVSMVGTGTFQVL